MFRAVIGDGHWMHTPETNVGARDRPRLNPKTSLVASGGPCPSNKYSGSFQQFAEMIDGQLVAVGTEPGDHADGYQ